MFMKFTNYYIFVHYLYFLWFSSKPLFAIARYSLRYSLLVLGKKYAAIYHNLLFKTLIARLVTSMGPTDRTDQLTASLWRVISMLNAEVK